MTYNPLKLKKELRSHFLEVRENLATDSALEKSRQITSHLMRLPVYKSAKTIHTYVSISERKEVHTHELIKESIRQNKKVVVPKMQAAGKMIHSPISSFDELRPNRLGIPEPDNVLNPENSEHPEIDIVIVPMVAGDRQKNRLGYGKGYYDRFLEKISALKIGLLFNCQLYQDMLPTEEFDVPLDMLITESEIVD